MLERQAHERHAIPGRIVAHACFFARWRPMQAMAAGIEEQTRPLRPRDRPLMLLTFDEVIDMADLQANAGLTLPTVVDVLEKTIEEAPLHIHAVIGVEMRPVLEPMHL